MPEFIVKSNALQGFLSSLTKGGRQLFAPTADERGFLNMGPATAEKISLDFTNTHMSPKGVFFPQNEKMMAFHKDDSKDKAFVYQEIFKGDEPKVIFGLRPCDARGLAIANRVFQNDRFTDPYWKKKYESAVKIGLACVQPDVNCFCTATGGSPFGETGLDVLAFVKDGDLYLKTLTEAGEKLLAEAQGLDAGDAASPQAELKAKAEEGMEKYDANNPVLTRDLMEMLNAPHWADTAAPCLNCGVCTFVCPTCHCFDIQDEQDDKGGVRMRQWDTCMSPLFTMHGTGHNPRPSKVERVRQRFMHKLKYIPIKQDTCGCVGCGRCVSLCPVNIDIRVVANTMRTA